MKKSNLIIASLLIAMSLLCGCSAKSAAFNDSTVMEETAAEAKAAAYDGAACGDGSFNGGETVFPAGQKFIKTVHIGFETKEFQSLVETLKTKVGEYGGYVESSDIGRSYRYDSGGRHAYLYCRIPENELDSFISDVEGAGTGKITSRSENIQDVTLDYTDTENRKKTLELEAERLNELLEKAEDIDSVIAIESKLSDVRYELDSYESQLRSYDNRINYSSVSFDVYEVSLLSKVKGLIPTAVRFAVLTVLVLIAVLLFRKVIGKKKGKQKKDPENAADTENKCV